MHKMQDGESVKTSQRHNTKVKNFQGGRSRVLEVPSAYKTKKEKFQCGGSRYKLIVLRKVHNTCTTNMQKFPGWTFVLQTCGVLEVHNAVNTNI